MLALALGIQARKHEGRRTRVLWAGVAISCGVSTYANLLQGLMHQSDISLSGYAWLVSLRPILLSGMLPALVLYLSEIVGDDVSYAVLQATRETRQDEREHQPPYQPHDSTDSKEQEADTFTMAHKAYQTQKAEALEALLAFYANNPTATQAQAGAHVGRSRQWVSSQLTRLEREGVITRNGGGVETTG